MRVAVLGLVMAGWAGAALAQEVAVETGTIGDTKAVLHLHPFLTAEELATLRVVLSNKEAQALFIGAKKGFAAMAVNPDEGFIRGGKPVASAVALAEFDTPEAASAAAITDCAAVAKSKTPCVVVLEVEAK
ncbi:MAG: hypothetical protein R3D63_06670 [Paracoccaceae bacterium]